MIASDTTASVAGNPDRDVIAATSMLATSAASISTRVTSVPGNGARRMSAAFCSTESFWRSQRPVPVLTARSVPRMPIRPAPKGDTRVSPLRESVFPPQGLHRRMVRERVNGLRDPFE